MEKLIVKKIKTLSKKRRAVYNLDIEGNHNYFVNGILVHNCDEAALIHDDEEAMVFRMLGDEKENFYFKIGNPWDSGHFDKTRDDPNYYYMKADWKKALKEDRITIDIVEEARKKPFFGVLYECNRPPLDTVDERGWASLLTKDDIDRAIVDEYVPFGFNKLGVDIAKGGRNFSVIAQRHKNVARMVNKNNDTDTMNQAERVLNLREHQLAGMDGTFIDYTGVGTGVFDILSREIKRVMSFDGAERPEGEEMDDYINLRAMCFWKLRLWILAGGKLMRTEETPDNTWYQLSTIKYRRSIERLRGKLQIMSKEDMLKEGIPSPDVADALMMTFATADTTLPTDDEETQKEEGFNKSMEKHNLFPTV